MAFNKDIHTLQYQVFTAVIYITYTLYLITVLGVSVNAPQYLDQLQKYVKIYVSLFLIYRFNPFRHVEFTELDAKIAFSAGQFLLTTTFIDSILKKYLNTIKEYLQLFRFSNTSSLII